MGFDLLGRVLCKLRAYIDQFLVDFKKKIFAKGRMTIVYLEH